jgi:hypothetical protein
MKFKTTNPRPATMTFETNDCALRAFSTAYFLPYSVVHAMFAKAGRKPGKGVTLTQIQRVMEMIRKEFQITSTMSKRRFDEPTFAQFAKGEGKRGYWVVCAHNHAVALRNGVYMDAHPSTCGARRRVHYTICIAPTIKPS